LQPGRSARDDPLAEAACRYRSSRTGAVAQCFALQTPDVERVTTAALVKMMNGADKPLLIDVGQWNAAHGTLPGAYWFQASQP
jgi:hypothetical protein